MNLNCKDLNDKKIVVKQKIIHITYKDELTNLTLSYVIWSYFSFGNVYVYDIFYIIVF